MRRLLVFLLLCVCSLSVFADTAAQHAAAGKAALERDDNEKAVELLTKAIELQPNKAEYHYLLGSAYGDLAQKAGLLGKASLAKKTKAAFERAVELDPNFIDARMALISYYLIAPGFMGGSVDKAREQAAEIKKRDALAGHRAVARIHRHEKKPELARKELVEAVREQPKSPAAHYFLANQYFVDKMYAEAVHEYEYALQLDDKFMPAWFRLGVTAADTNSDHARGESALKKYLAHKPGEDEPSLAAAWYYLGKLYEKQGRKADAKKSYLSALQLEPDDKDIKEALKRVS